MTKNIPILHVDGSLTEYVDKRGVLHRIAGIGGYLVINGKIVDSFSKTLKDIPYSNHHEEYAIIEGLKWLKNKRILTVKIKTDSMNAINLFNHKRKSLKKEDKFFLTQYLMLDYTFEDIEIMYHNRSDDDISHNLSRKYIQEIPKDAVKIHHMHHKKVVINSDASYYADKDILKILIESMEQIQYILK